jgi:hypothetical protein
VRRGICVVVDRALETGERDEDGEEEGWGR